LSKNSITYPAIDLPVVFIIGAPRSGTTWVQQMLGAHPSIVTSQETDLLNRYIEPLCHAWNRDLATNQKRRFKGLGAVLTQDEFDEWIVRSIATVYQKVRSLKSSASVVLDKNPTYSLKTKLICRYLPQAHFIHVLRDGRDVVASMLAASTGWGRSWAPKKTVQAAKTWKKHVLGAQLARDYCMAYIEVRYEQLLRNGPVELSRLFDFCKVPATLTECRLIYERFAFDNIRSPGEYHSSILWSGEVERRHGTTLREPDGFFREGRSGAWAELLTARQHRAIKKVAGTLLGDLGYSTVNNARPSMSFERVIKFFCRT